MKIYAVVESLGAWEDHYDLRTYFLSKEVAQKRVNEINIQLEKDKLKAEECAFSCGRHFKKKPCFAPRHNCGSTIGCANEVDTDVLEHNGARLEEIEVE